MRENVGTFLREGRKLAHREFPSAGQFVSRVFSYLWKIFPDFADLRLVFAYVHGAFRRGLTLSTTASAFFPAAPQLWWPVFQSSRSASVEIPSGSFPSPLFCAPMINSFS